MSAAASVSTGTQAIAIGRILVPFDVRFVPHRLASTSLDTSSFGSSWSGSSRNRATKEKERPRDYDSITAPSGRQNLANVQAVEPQSLFFAGVPVYPLAHGDTP